MASRTSSVQPANLLGRGVVDVSAAQVDNDAFDRHAVGVLQQRRDALGDRPREGEQVRVNVPGGNLTESLVRRGRLRQAPGQHCGRSRRPGSLREHCPSRDHGNNVSPCANFATSSMSSVKPSPGFSGIASIPSASSFQPPAAIWST